MVKALTRLDRLGGGSREWRAFTAELLPSLHAGLEHLDFLLADAAEAAAMHAARAAERPHVPAQEAGPEEGGAGP